MCNYGARSFDPTFSIRPKLSSHWALPCILGHSPCTGFLSCTPLWNSKHPSLKTEIFLSHAPVLERATLLFRICVCVLEWAEGKISTKLVLAECFRLRNIYVLNSALKLLFAYRYLCLCTFIWFSGHWVQLLVNHSTLFIHAVVHVDNACMSVCVCVCVSVTLFFTDYFHMLQYVIYASHNSFHLWGINPRSL